MSIDFRQGCIDDWGQLAVMILQGLTAHAQKYHSANQSKIPKSPNQKSSRKDLDFPLLSVGV